MPVPAPFRDPWCPIHNGQETLLHFPSCPGARRLVSLVGYRDRNILAVSGHLALPPWETETKDGFGRSHHGRRRRDPFLASQHRRAAQAVSPPGGRGEPAPEEFSPVGRAHRPGTDPGPHQRGVRSPGSGAASPGPGPQRGGRAVAPGHGRRRLPGGHPGAKAIRRQRHRHGDRGPPDRAGGRIPQEPGLGRPGRGRQRGSVHLRDPSHFPRPPPTATWRRANGWTWTPTFSTSESPASGKNRTSGWRGSTCLRGTTSGIRGCSSGPRKPSSESWRRTCRATSGASRPLSRTSGPLPGRRRWWPVSIPWNRSPSTLR